MAKIDFEKAYTKNEVRISDIEIGHTFIREGYVLMRVKPVVMARSNDLLVVNLQTGTVWDVKDDVVVPCKVIATVEKEIQK